MPNSWITVVSIFFIVNSVISIDYCKIKPCSSKSAMCLYQGKGLGRACKGYRKGGLTSSEKKAVMDEHNKLRSQLAEGQVTGFPKAADMTQLVWDDELELMAQTWANQCKFSHDTCREAERFYVGQNIAYYSTTGTNEDREAILRDQVNEWFKEYKDCPSSQIKKFTSQGNGGVIGHFTQLAWSRSTLIGCGCVETVNDGWTTTTLYCNYGPGGNRIGERVYTEGSPCSSCPSKTSCKGSDYKGLCS